jgi:hypothetical protein
LLKYGFAKYSDNLYAPCTFFERFEAVTKTSLKIEALWEGEDKSADKQLLAF